MTPCGFAVTRFEHFAATAKIEELFTLESLAERIRGTSQAREELLPWLKLARLGSLRTIKSSLRHDANMVTISGVEADYDAERMSFDDAVDLLAQKGITAIVYTSPSHAEDRQRWRVLCPLSQEMPPGRRDHFLGRLNGLFRGIFAGESWTLSQAYYYGSVNRNPSHRVEVIDGHAIDAHDDLDMIWLGEPRRRLTPR